jgi:uncharacterized protein YkwD
MKTIRTIFTILVLASVLFSCKKNDDDLHITAFEDQLHKAVNNYRKSEGLNELAHNFDVLSRESKGHAEGRANGSIPDNFVENDMNERWHTVADKLGVNNVTNQAHISSIYTGDITAANAAEVAAAVVAAWASNPSGREILKGEYTIHGPGEGKTSDGRTYIMHMFCKFTNPQ